VAKLGKVWGLRGALTVRLYNPNSELEWADGDVQWLRGKGFPASPVAIDRWQEKGGKLLLTFEGIRNPQEAKPLTGMELLAPAEFLPELDDPDEVYVHELQGMTVVDEIRGDLGTIQAVFTTGANDVWVVRNAQGETLIPAIKGVVLEIDRAARRVRVHYELV
jgi:16S rRNA processing protein RimM